MTDFEAYEKAYKGWSTERHIKCFEKIEDVIGRRTEFSLGRGVAHGD